jgi:sugar transferase (PEP-CTERM/EpsH1 system associated)
MRILFLTHRLPYPPNRGDRIRAHQELRVLAGRHEVHVVSLVHDAEEESNRSRLGEVAASVSTAMVPRAMNLLRGIAALPSTRPLTHVLLSSPALGPALRGVVERSRPEAVLAYCSSMVRLALEPLLAGTPVIMDMVDVDSEKWAALAETCRPPMRWVYAREARRLGGFEADATRKARVTYVVNDRERASLRRLAGPSARVDVLPNGVDLAHLTPPGAPAPSSDVVFCGVMDYVPNEQGALWLSREVWPRVRAVQPDARLVLVGARPTRRLLDLPRADTSVIVTGSVPDVRPYLWNGAVAAAPLLVARGVQNKVLEAVGAGLPAVITPVVAEGLPAEVTGACRVAGSAEAFAQAILDLLALPPDGRRDVAAAGRLGDLSWERQLDPLLKELERIEAESRPSA